ncbi:hypothetical protein B0H12DRAFT_1155623 [Mycena haematopus]|nr:hypothetical protein B0H12DRAFT_1155623 [Mycena haematopus]
MTPRTVTRTTENLATKGMTGIMIKKMMTLAMKGRAGKGRNRVRGPAKNRRNPRNADHLRRPPRPPLLHLPLARIFPHLIILHIWLSRIMEEVAMSNLVTIMEADMRNPAVIVEDMEVDMSSPPLPPLPQAIFVGIPSAVKALSALRTTTELFSLWDIAEFDEEVSPRRQPSTLLQLLSVPKARKENFRFGQFFDLQHGLTCDIARTSGVIRAQLVIEPNAWGYHVFEPYQNPAQ